MEHTDHTKRQGSAKLTLEAENHAVTDVVFAWNCGLSKVGLNVDSIGERSHVPAPVDSRH